MSIGYNKISLNPFVYNKQGQQCHFIEMGIIRENLKQLRAFVELSNLAQDVDRLTESLADALTYSRQRFHFQPKHKAGKIKNTWFDKEVNKSIINKISQSTVSRHSPGRCFTCHEGIHYFATACGHGRIYSNVRSSNTLTVQLSILKAIFLDSKTNVNVTKSFWK